jgi:hypothetical protein
MVLYPLTIKHIEHTGLDIYDTLDHILINE